MCQSDGLSQLSLCSHNMPCCVKMGRCYRSIKMQWLLTKWKGYLCTVASVNTLSGWAFKWAVKLRHLIFRINPGGIRHNSPSIHILMSSNFVFVIIHFTEMRWLRCDKLCFYFCLCFWNNYWSQKVPLRGGPGIKNSRSIIPVLFMRDSRS